MRRPGFTVALVLVAACNAKPSPPKKADPAGNATGTAPTEQATPREELDPSALPKPALDVAFLRETTRLLSHDAMEGRGIGTEGGKRAVEAIRVLMERAGLEPAGDGGGWTQRVPLRSVAVEMPNTGLWIKAKEGDGYARLHFGREVLVNSFGPAGTQSLTLPVVFAGYGVTAPEYGWDDYAGIDVRGKLVVVFVGDPPTGDERFDGEAMTYYGRWSYKFERALAAGAAGCLVVHEDEPASYGWNVVLNSWSKPRFQTLESDGSLPPSLAVQGWISAGAADKLAKMAGQSLAAWHDAAMRKNFRAQELPVFFGGKLTTTERRLEDVNVVGRIPGTQHPDEGVVLTAHWDHLGRAEQPVDGDDIYNGAIDNASGVAGMLAVAGSLAADRPERTVIFVATTAEEQGLLGARYHADHPALPIERTWAAFNLDSMNVDGRTRNVEVVGMGKTTLEDVLAEVAKKQGRVLTPDERPEAGGYFRSDHFAFARKGVPALYFRGGLDMVEGGRAAGEALLERRKARYHTVDDEYDPSWTFEGALEDASALADVIRAVTAAAERPSWRKGAKIPGAPRPKAPPAG
ncbi:MAG: M20/M25/M40 family metallo-hydrolase [Deltaproteobacteria bacterium]|nr:MAG: M20/M25/M40 family metallo-hydrolase [Deltaproteobacteria bacterium]